MSRKIFLDLNSRLEVTDDHFFSSEFYIVLLKIISIECVHFFTGNNANISMMTKVSLQCDSLKKRK